MNDTKLMLQQSQMRLGAFFAKPKAENTPPSTPDDVSEGASSRRTSIASIDMERPVLETPKKSQLANVEYNKCFLPFFVPEHTEVAPINRFKIGREVDFEIRNDSQVYTVKLEEHFGRPRKRIRTTVPVKEIIQNIQATGLDVVELDHSALEVLAKYRYKCLQFREDVRPPYQGTFTRSVQPAVSRKVSRKPFSRELPEINYDYDSEAEWEPPAEDDEDLEDDDEMSDAEDAGDDINDFLDDADDIARKKGPVSDMEPISSGLCWIDGSFDDNGANIEQYRMDVLHDSTTFPINPYSTSHWHEDSIAKAAAPSNPVLSKMQPPRHPLSSLSPNASPPIKVEVGVDGKPLPIGPSKKGSSNKTPKLIDQEFLRDFKQAVDGSDLTKLGLIEVLKKQFPTCSKEAIRDTLATVATRIGKKEAEKKWQLVSTSE